jgi:tetratricopeptide (TPR) repeat protein
MRIHRPDDAGAYFEHARKAGPASPLPYEGLGLLAADRKQTAEAIQLLKESMDRGSVSFVTYAIYGQQKLESKFDAAGNLRRMQNDQAWEIRSALERSIELMPSFAESHRLLGILEFVQGWNLEEAEGNLQHAVELDPEDDWLKLPLAEVQWRRSRPDAARQTLATLQAPTVDEKVRARAEALLKEMNQSPGR